MTNQQGIRYTSDRERRCPNDGSILREGGKCMACGFIKGKTHAPRVVVDGLVYDADQVPESLSELVNAATLKITAGHSPDAPVLRVVTVTPVSTGDYAGHPFYCSEHAQDCHTAAGLKAHQRSKHKAEVNV